MSKLFEKTQLKGLNLSYRFVRSATYEGMADRLGNCTPNLIRLYAGLARGGTGLIITGNTYVGEEGKAVLFQLGIHEDRFIPGLKKITDRVHEAGGKIMMQLAHIGVFARPEITGCKPLVISKTENPHKEVQREMTPDDIGRVVRSVADAAQRAKRAGFDGVQIHAAHGYLHSQFLSPQFNHRRDRYGGSLENRIRAVVETVREIRRAVGPDYPVTIKMNAQDFTANGLFLEESVRVGIMLSNADIDAIELSGGLLTAYSCRWDTILFGC